MTLRVVTSERRLPWSTPMSDGAKREWPRNARPRAAEWRERKAALHVKVIRLRDRTDV